MGALEDLVSNMLLGDRPSLASLIAQVEGRDKDLAKVVKLLFPKTGRAQILGITGLPGAARQALIGRMISEYRSQGRRVAVVALDPYSPFSGGTNAAIYNENDPDFYYWSEGARSELREQSHASTVVKEILLVLDSAGFDVILLETSGIGQTEMNLLRVTQSVIVLPLLERADFIQVFQNDFQEAGGKTDVQVDDMSRLLALTDSHYASLKASGKLHLQRIQFVKNLVGDILTERLSLSIEHQFKTSSGEELLEKLRLLEYDPYIVADLISGV